MKKHILFLFFFVSFCMSAQDSPGVYTIENVKINTSHSDFGTAFLGNDKVVFAAPRSGFTMNREEHNGQPFLDLHVAEVSEDGKLIRKQKLPGDVNTKYHEGMVTFSKDMKTVFFSANGKIKRTKRKKNKEAEIKTKGTANIHLFKASINEHGEWGDLEMLPFNDDGYSTGHPVLNRDDTKLYFVSDGPESLGKTDIFVVDLHEDGTYGKPVNLGPKINSAEREMFPFIGKDNVLYFSSDGFDGMGELDVYASKIFDNTVSDPINLEAPVNSISDDFAYIIDDHKHKGYFSSNREGGRGDDDIYSFTASPPIYIECQQEITGVVKNIDTQELIPNMTIVLFDEAGEKLESFISNEQDARFSFDQACNANYKIQGFLEGHLVGEMDIRTVNDLNAEPLEIVFNVSVETAPITDVIAAGNSEEILKEESSENDEIGEMAARNTKEEMKSASMVAAEAVDDKGEDKQEQVAMNEGSSASALNNESRPRSADEVASTKERSSNVTGSDTPSSQNKALATSAAVVAAGSDTDKQHQNNSGSDKEDPSVAENPETSVSNIAETSNKESESNSYADVNKAVSDDSIDEVVAATIIEPSEGSESTEASVTSIESQQAASEAIANVDPEKARVAESQETASLNSNERMGTNSESGSEVSEKNEGQAMVSKSRSISDTDLAVNHEPTKVNLENLKINTIYFDFDKHTIRYDAKLELDKLVKVMMDYPDMKIEVNAHTDIRGKKKYNEGLSNKRADATSKYLIDHGVDSKRISSYWFGELRPAEKCTKESPCSGFQHQLNRRSEFSIIDKSSDQIIVQSENRKNSMVQEKNTYTSNSGLFMNYNFYEDKEVYTVQVGAFKGKVQTDKYSKLTDLFNHRYDDGLNRYYSGIFETSAEARNHMKSMRKNGYSGAFVVGLKGEARF
ncbi:OmpA family protein [Lutimonas sp.]|uniref:OmpA family protein n=1 Tax=Lutimonas sp. TaxID=1872403 RepID=UPI003D9AF260